MDDSENILLILMVSGVFVAVCWTTMVFILARVRRKREAEAKLFDVPQGVADLLTGQAPVMRMKIPFVTLELEDNGLEGALDTVFSLAVLRPALLPLYQRTDIGMSMRAAVEECAHIKHGSDIIALIDNKKGELGAVVNAVTLDPMLSVAVLTRANTARYGSSGGARSLKKAIEIIGYGELREIIHRECLVREFKGVASLDSSLFDALWQHSILTGAIAGSISALFPGMDRSLAFTAGLLHDIGKFIVIRSKKVELSSKSCLLPYCGQGLNENLRLWTVDHAQLGLEAATTWGLNPAIGRLIAMHHRLEIKDLRQADLERPELEQLFVLHVANQLAKFYSMEPRQSNYLVPLHYSLHSMVERNSLLNVLSAPEFCEELERVREMRL